MMLDCVVVGAGPAGSTAAYHLARLGRTVRIIEKQSLPRYKPCGGGVSPLVQEWFDFDLGPAISSRVTRFRCTWEMDDPVDGEMAPGSSVWMVRREHFDHFIVQHAVELGADLWDGLAVTGLERIPNGWRVQTDREPIEARTLVAADGAKGPTAKWLGFSDRKRVIAGAVEAEAGLCGGPTGDTLHLEFGMCRGGYLWNFPKADGHSLGIGAMKGEGPKDLKRILGDYSAGFTVDLAETRQYGHPICCWNGHQPLHVDGAVLAGEAACVVDPFSAEGIRPSIFSGMQAAIHLHQALGGDSKAYARYSQTMRDEHGADMVWARRLAKAFYAFPSLSYQRGVKHPRATEWLGRLIFGEARYRDVAQRAIKRLAGVLRA